MQARDVLACIGRSVKALYNQGWLVLKRLIGNLGYGNFQKTSGFYADVFVERLELVSRDPVFEYVRGWGRSQRGVSRSIVPRQGEFALIAAERPALILSEPCSVIIVSHGLKAQGDLVV